MTTDDPLDLLNRAAEKNLLPFDHSGVKTLGKFILLRKLGFGAAGEVYLADDTSLKRKVALKVLTRFSETDVERFYREARACAKLNHPNIIHIHEVGEIEGKHYISMQFIDGFNLEKLELDIEESLKAIRDIALAVEHAHENNIVHRDIKPSNIIRDSDGEAFITDFGIAKLLEERHLETLSVTGMIIGTPAYMSPEQAEGKIKEIDPRSDVYALGATLYYLLTRQPPYKGETTMQMIDKIINDDPQRPGEINKQVPPEVDTIIMKAMQKEKSRRYQGAKELADDINRFLKGEPIHARRTSVTYRVIKKLKRHKVTVRAFAILTAVLLLALAAYFYFTHKQAEDYKTRADQYFKEANWHKALEFYSLYLSIKNDQEALEKKRKCELALGESKKIEAARALVDRAAVCINSIYQEFYKKQIDSARIKSLKDEALKYLDDSIDAYPLAIAYYYKGRLYSELLEFQKAKNEIDQAVKLDPDFKLAYIERTLIYLENYVTASTTGAKEIIPEYISTMQNDLAKLQSYGYDPELARYMKLMDGVNDLLRSNYQEAIDVLQSGYDQFKDDNFLYYLGITYNLKNDRQNALDVLNKAIDIKPLNAKLYVERAFTYKGMNNFKAAMEDLDRAITITPDYYRIYFCRAKTYAKLKEFDKAIDDYSRVIESHKNMVLAYYNRGLTYYDKEEYDNALKDFDEVIKLNPSFAKAYYHKAMVFILKKDYATAMKELEIAINLNPNYALAYCARSLCYFKSGNKDAAVNDINKAISIDPKEASFYFNRGNISFESGDFDSAIADYTKALDLNPDYLDALQNRASAYCIKGELKKALDDLENLIKLDPTRKEKLQPDIDELKKTLQK